MITPSKKKAGTRVLPVGKYTLKCRYNEFKKENIPFELKPDEVTKIHVVFKPFFVGAKCSNGGAMVSYEIYSSSGQLIYEKKAPCSKTLKVILDDGKYTVEASSDDAKKDAQINVGSDSKNSVIIDLSNLNHEDLIKADTPASTPTTSNQQPQLSDEAKKQLEEIQKAAQMIQMLEGMMSGTQPSNTTPSKNNTQEDKELDDMAKDLEMFSK
jgi:hypothetical protein